jgi:hypothetical protein
MNIFNLPVHEICDDFPFKEERIDRIIESLKKIGQLNPIKVAEVDGVMTLIDGRHRREACRIAGIEPEYRLLNGQDLADVIIAENCETHDFSAGQKAMYEAYHKPDPAKLKRKSDVSNGDNKRLLSKARKIIAVFGKESLEVKNVKTGILAFSRAYEDAALEQKEREQREQERIQREQERKRKANILKKEAPDLWMKVKENQISEDRAWIIYEKEQMDSRSEEINYAQTLGSAMKQTLSGLMCLTDKSDISELVVFEGDPILSGVVKRSFPNGVKNEWLQYRSNIEKAMNKITKFLEAE